MSYQHWQEICFYLDEIDKIKADFERNKEGQESLELTRRAMLHLLDNLRTSLEKQLEKHHASLIMFAFIAAIDEKMQGYTYTMSQVKWVPLQKDFYSAYTAGEVFYKSIDEILDDPNTPNIVYQVFYAMLKRGFQGKYQDSKTQIGKYTEMLKDKIPIPQIVQKAEHVSFTPQKKRRLKRWHCYGISACAFALVFATLYFGSNL